MVIELSEFWKRLVRAGVLDAPQCQAWADQYRNSHDGDPPRQAELLARFLVQESVLTPFQSSAFLAEQAIELRLGSYLIRDPKAATPLARFAEASRTTDGAIGVLLRTGPGNSWLVKHAAIEDTNLQSYVTEIIGDHEAVFSPVGEGEVLFQKLSDQPWPTLAVVSLGKKIAAAMSVLHDAGLAHGAIRADRVWMRNDGRVVLLRDPSGPARTESPIDNLNENKSTASDGWLETLDDPALYMSPELVSSSVEVDSALPSVSSDIYSLGCLLFRLARGRYPIQGHSSSQTLSLHATEIPAELAAAIEQGEKGDPLYRVLAYAMAKSPAARFGSGKQLEAALIAVGQSLPLEDEQDHTVQSGSKKLNPTHTDNDIAETSAHESTARGSSASLHNVEERKTVRNKENAVSETQVAKLFSPTKIPTNTAKTKRPKTMTADPVPAVEPQQTIRDGDHPISVRTRRKRKNRAPWVLSGLAGVVVLQIIALAFMDPTQPVVKRRRAEFVPPAVVPRVSNRTPRKSVVPDSSPPQNDSDSGPKSYQLVQDRRLLYVPPTVAEDALADPITLDLLPPGPAMIVSVRLATVERSAVCQSVLDAFSPELQTMVDSMATRLGVPVENVSRVTAALYSGGSGDRFPVAYSVTLSQPQSMETLLKTWEVSAARTREGHTIYVGDEANSDAFYLQAEQVEAKQISRFAVGAIDPITDLASIDGEAIPLPRSLKSLWDATNQNVDVSVLVTSNYLFADGRSLLQRSMPEAIEPLRRILIPHTSAVLLMADSPVQSDAAQQLYSEVRFSAAGGVTEASLAQLVRQAIEQWPVWASEFSTKANPDASWLPLADRLPSMIGFVADRVRVGVADRTAVANLYVPSVAVPQLSLGTILAMNTPMGEMVNSGQPSGNMLTIKQILDRPMSVSFGQESLEFAIDAIIDSLGQQLPAGNQVPGIQIIGGDLQLMGITQNQQIRDFDKRDMPLRQVLTELVVAANPDKSATGPTDQKQSLIWVVAGEGEGQQILVTTRQAAEAKGYDLPPEFTQ